MSALHWGGGCEMQSPPKWELHLSYYQSVSLEPSEPAGGDLGQVA